MSSIPKFLASFIVIMIAVWVGISIIFAGLVVTSSKTHHNNVISQVEASNFSDTVIQDCIQKAEEKGYALSVSKEMNVSSGEHFKVVLSYDVLLPLFGKVHTGKWVGYAMRGASINELGDADHYFEIQNGVLGIKADYRWATGLDDYASNEGSDKVGSLNHLLPTEIVIPTYFNGEKVMSLRDYMFANCSTLTKVSFEEGVETIGDYAFLNCTGLTTIGFPDSMEENGYAVLKGTNITALKAPFVGGVHDDKKYSFIGYLFGADISNLTKANYEQNNTVVPSSLTQVEISKYVGPFACYDMDSLTNLIIGQKVTYFDRYPFDYCDGLTKVVIPKNVESFGDYGGFGYCKNLEEVSFEEGSKLHTLSQRGFYECSKLAKINLPNTLRTINDNCFDDCDSLMCDTPETGKLPEGLEHLGRGALRHCDGFETILIPSTVKEIEPLIFNQCESLTHIQVASGNQHFVEGEYGELLTIDKKEIVQYPYDGSETYVVPASVVKIREYAFGDTDKLKTLDFSVAYEANALTTLEDNSVSSCSNINNDIKLPKSVKTIGGYAFYHTGQWSNFWVGENVTKIGDYAFYDAGSMVGATYLLMESVPTLGNKVFFTNTLAGGATPDTKYRVYVKNDNVKNAFVVDTHYRAAYTDIIQNETMNDETVIPYS